MRVGNTYIVDTIYVYTKAYIALGCTRGERVKDSVDVKEVVESLDFVEVQFKELMRH